MTRKMTEHKALSPDRELLIVVNVYEEGLSRSEIDRLNPYTKRFKVLRKKNGRYKF